jgi:hypothetical protein
MTTLVVGGDRIDAIRRELGEYKLNDVEHWSGRKPGDLKRSIPDRIRLVVVVSDQLSHSMMYNATISATQNGLPIIYTRRSGRELRVKLEERYGKAVRPKIFRPVSSGWVLPFNDLALSY